jgi:predicted phosphodiesterase
MALRAGPEAAFPQALCQLKLPRGVKRAEIDGRPLPIPHAHVDRIIVMGDSGCRLKGLLVQDCNDPRAWPFAAVSRLAAAERPDLVIHVGDYYYRESACPLNWSGCAGSPHGDAWVAEFYEPAAPLLAAAPWVFARGNHESCNRGGRGWFRLLDAGDTPQLCPGGAAAPFAVPLDSTTGEGVRLHILDSADTSDRLRPADAVAAFKAGIETVTPEGGRSEWIVTHRPVWGLVPVARIGPFGPLNVPINATEQAAAQGERLEDVQLILSGHIHHFASFSFGKPRPAQLIVGTGGDIGEAGDAKSPEGDVVEIDNLEAKSLEFERFGYFVFDRAGADWRGAFKDTTGKALAACTLHERILKCVKV